MDADPGRHRARRCAPEVLPPNASGEQANANADVRRTQESGVPIATSAEQLLVDGGVRAVQDALHERGFLDAAPDGEPGATTERALVEFQKNHGLAATGMPDRQTLRELGLDPDELIRRAR